MSQRPFSLAFSSPVKSGPGRETVTVTAQWESPSGKLRLATRDYDQVTTPAREKENDMIVRCAANRKRKSRAVLALTPRQEAKKPAGLDFTAQVYSPPPPVTSCLH